MSQRNSDYARKERDLYETPEWVTEVLLANLWPAASCIWEPACGSGRMAAVLNRRYPVYTTDIHPDGRDFLFERLPAYPVIDGIITNPPYDLAQQFCEHALELMEPRGLVAMLLRVDFDSAKSRAHLFRDCPAWCHKLVLTKRITWFVEADGKPKASPSENHAWYIWDWKHEGAPTLAYGP
jgi:hypothetical protein